MFEDAEKSLKKFVNKIVIACIVLSCALFVISLMMMVGGEGYGLFLLFISIIGLFSSYVFGALLTCIADLVEQSKLQTLVLKEINNKLDSLYENKE